MLSDYYNEIISVDRLQLIESEEGEDENTTKKEYALYLANICAHIQPLDASIGQDIKDGFGKNFLLFCPRNDIIEGDRINWGENEYRVVAVEDFAGTAGMRSPHMEIQMRIFET